MNPAPVAATASTAAAPPGDGSRDSVQVAPPLTDSAVNGAVWPPEVADMPTATIRRPLTVTRWSWARTEFMGSARVTARQVRPLAEIQAPGWAPADPTATKPPALAVAASICREAPGPSSAPADASVPRCQPVRPADHQAAATVRPATAWRPTMTYPPWPAATATVKTPAPAKAGSVSADCQAWPPADVTTTGCCAAADCTPPAATHPAAPCTTPDSSWSPGRFSADAGVPAPRDQVVPAFAENHVAGKPFALPTATWLLPSAAMPLTATSGSSGAGDAREADRGEPPGVVDGQRGLLAQRPGG